jgi:hypothetical protein
VTKPQKTGADRRAIDVIRERSALTRRSIEIPEWGLTMYFGKMVVADMEAVDERRQDDDEKKMTPQERNMILLVSKAQNEDGTPMFRMGDIMFLRTEADFVVLQRVVNFMFETAHTNVEKIAAAKAEIEQRPPLASASP